MTDQIQEGQIVDGEPDIPTLGKTALAIPVGARELTLADVEKFECAIALYKRARIAALRLTSVHDWVNFGGNPYMEEDGAVKLIAPFSIGFRNIRHERKVERDSQSEYTAIYVFGDAYSKSLGVEVSEIVGSATTRHKFHVAAAFGNREDVDITNVMKHAHSNFRACAIKALLGLDGLTWEDLAEAGLEKEKMQGVEFKTGKGRAEAEEKKSAAEGKTADDMSKEVWTSLVEVASGDAALASELLKLSTTFAGKDGKITAGRSDIAKMSDKWVFAYKANALKKLRGAFDEGVSDPDDLRDAAWAATGIGGPREGAPG